MTTTREIDLSLFATDDSALLEAIRIVGGGGGGTAQEAALLERVKLVDNGALTAAGRELYRLAWVAKDRTLALSELGQVIRPLLPIQVIDQELRGYEAVTDDGVLNLLRLHRASPEELTIEDLRRCLRWLNRVGALVYSQKHKTVRVIPPRADAADIGEDRRLPGVISPRTPFTNVVRLRRILRSLRGEVWWADPHFGVRALEDLAEELDPAAVTALRIISGDASNVVSTRAQRDFDRFTTEMAAKNLGVEWRVDKSPGRDWHDRWLVDDCGTFNIPPVNTLYKGDWSELLPSTVRPPLQVWWQRAIEWP